MKKKKNSTYYRYTRKQILVLSVLVIFCLSLVTILARYVLKYANNFYTSTKEFYFETPNVVLDEIPKTLQGKTFVVTGSVNHYKNRNELKADIVAHGGTVVGSVSSKTSYLINSA